jgi:uncharacterized repeat protein (TIGR01451 family)
LTARVFLSGAVGGERAVALLSGSIISWRIVRMKPWRPFRLALVLVLAAVLSGAAGVSLSSADPGIQRAVGKAAGVQAGEAIIVDHTTTDLGEIPEYWIEKAKDLLRVSYGHTSHGSQLITGMGVLESSPLNVGGLYDFSTNGAVQADVLSLADYTPSGDLGNPDRVTWEARTRTYLDGPGSDRNVVVWSWCGQADTSEGNIDLYLNLMNDLEHGYPGVTFVYMTGHLNGTGETGNLHQRNEQIRNYCRANNKVLFDFADIESYDPNGDYFLDRGADDQCNYDSGNWADEWCAENPGSPLCDSCDCAHSRSLNCNLKGRAFWWMMARLAGWSGPGESQKAASAITPTYGQAITYTIVVQNLTAPLTATVYVTDVVPTGLSYVPGTLTTIGGTGTPNEGGTPTLAWSGVLSPTPAVTITYVTTVTAALPEVITNTATIDVPGYQTITTAVTLIANGHDLYMPLVLLGYQD